MLHLKVNNSVKKNKIVQRMFQYFHEVGKKIGNHIFSAIGAQK